MTPDEAANIVLGIVDSLERNPAQFQIEISVIGQQITSQGGTGLSIHATGGGPGSQTVGQVITAGGGSVEIAQRRAEVAMSEQLAALVRELRHLAEEFRRPSPSRERAEGIRDRLTNTWVPGVITSVLGNVIYAFFRSHGA